MCVRCLGFTDFTPLRMCELMWFQRVLPLHVDIHMSRFNRTPLSKNPFLCDDYSPQLPGLIAMGLQGGYSAP